MPSFLLKQPRLLSAAIGTAAVGALFAAAPLAEAQGLTQAQVSAIVTMLEAFGADSGTIANVEAALNGTPVSTQTGSTTPSSSGDSQNGPGNATSCMSLSGTLSIGSQGEDVTKLQQFLAKDKSIYPQGLVTGYFGHDTEDAVQRYQAAHGIVATGTPDSTGYGVVGPSTRGELEREMEQECNSGDAQQSGDATSTSSQEGDSGSTSTTTSSGSSDN